MEEKYFIEQVNKCRGLLLKLIGVYAYSVADRNDIYQEILLNAWRSAGTFRNEAKFSTWLYKVALNTIFTANRKQQKVSYHDNLEGFNLPQDPQAAVNEDIRELYMAIRQLSETDRVIITLHLEGYDNQEIANVLGIKPNYIGVKLFRIKEQLEKILKRI